MEESISKIKLAGSASLSAYELLILHASEAQEWATYLQDILRSSRKFCKRSILLYAVGQAEELQGNDFDDFRSCKCILLLLTGGLLDMLHGAAQQDALHRLLYPPHRVVVLLCGVSEVDVPTETFEDWQSWRKVCAEDEPALYVATILESITDSSRMEAEHCRKEATAKEVRITAASSAEERKDSVRKDEEEPASTGNPASKELCSPLQLTCLTVQPNRVLCGELETLFIIFTQKIDSQSIAEVEFSSASAAAKRVPGTVENEYTLSVAAPDMPAGAVSLTMHTGHSCLSLKPVTYYTSMGEVNRYLENATDPLNFMCQAFNFTSNATESLDNMLTDSLKSRMPATSLWLFGINQIEEDNMGYQRTVELPTLLHFAAKYGLKKLTTILLQCPGALHAYSVMNKNGDYPNTLAEKSGFLDLRQLMDKLVETADMPHCGDTANTEDGGEVYEPMSTRHMKKHSGCLDSIYEPMLEINPECAEELYEAMDSVNENPEEALLRIFFQGNSVQDDNEQPKSEEEERDNQNDLDQTEEEEDPYDTFLEDTYDVVDNTYNPLIYNRPPAPIPRTEPQAEPEKPMTHISRVFSDKVTSQSKTMEMGYPAVQPAVDATTPYYDPYAMMKTPGQRQLISLQERVKVGEISVDEAVQEFKAWKLDHERRANSIRYQQENLKRLRESIARRREKTGKEPDYEISAPLQNNLYWGSSAALPCAVYEPAPRIETPPPSVAQSIQRGSWKTGSTSSTSSTESNRLSTHSALSFSSGTELDIDDTLENVPLPLRLPRPADNPPVILPPRVPPRIPERVPDKMSHERYASYPTRALPQRPSDTQTSSAPPVPRRIR